ncbi:Uncharacterised protein [uncultured Ruminococcus sp.]|uniref:Uncharacterized protein n=1 Tax=Massiliimalia timonensis TaxID=1987501 RepID=A0A8J6P1D4_9FIRM|nr:hypothetical protein [Massiliimalia timonensis]MBC8610909.1 hypothetical protein [Massiliimalia timonensis]SCI02945.1 Uncharacterised protein [uncultured Clostridium sp.]SCI15156.1 Uncharacterised protein [uncultured Ruminococcus sp.]
MTAYTSIEEKYCISAGKNVAIEVTHQQDGSVKRCCLSHACKNSASPCRLEFHS